MAVLYVKDSNGKFTPIPALRGRKGDTPVRGVDYWTEEDVRQIQGYIDEEIGKISEEKADYFEVGDGLTMSEDRVLSAVGGGGGSEGVYELIETIVLDENVKTCSWTQAQGYKNILLLCECPAIPEYTSNSTHVTYVALGSKILFEKVVLRIGEIPHNTYQTFVSANINIEHGRLFGNSAVSRNNVVNVGTYNNITMQLGRVECNEIKELTIGNLYGTLYSGFKIEIWGVRA